MDVIYSLGEASATQVLEGLPDPPSRSAVRTFLRILEEKGHLKHHRSGREYVYRPTQPRTRAGRFAVRHLLDVFFDGSLEKAVALHLSDPRTAISDHELERLEALIRDARRKGR